MGSGQHPQYTRAWYAREAVGSSSQEHITALNEPKLQHKQSKKVQKVTLKPGYRKTQFSSSKIEKCEKMFLGEGEKSSKI